MGGSREEGLGDFGELPMGLEGFSAFDVGPGN